MSTGWNEKQLNGSTMKDQDVDPLYHEQKLTMQLHLALHL